MNYNYFDTDVNNNAVANVSPLEVVMICMQSGVFMTTSGQSAQFVGLLQKEVVLATIEEPTHTDVSVKRMVGGGFLDSLKSIAPHVLKALAPMIKDTLANSDNKYAEMGAKGLSALGYGTSGGRKVRHN